MNKAELVAAIVEKTQLTKKDSEAALDAFVEVVADQLKNGENAPGVALETFKKRMG